jgi:SAM-dependent methyltransferase
MSKKERLENDGEKRIINKTDLRTDTATKRVYIHRDYIAHVLRYTHVVKWFQKLKNRKDNLNILDMGCGKEFPILRMCYTNKLKPQYYLGLDIRKLNFDEFHKEMKPNFDYEFQQYDFINPLPKCKNGNWDFIIFLEVLEHNSKEAGIKILENIKNIMNPDTIFIMSTPSFNGKAAENHIYEWEYQELKQELEKTFIIENHYGTFASQKDIENVMSDCEKEIYEKLKDYYDSNFLSAVFAPIHPYASRNCLWRLRLK